MEVRLLTSKDSIAEMEYNAAYGMLTCHDNTDKLQNEEPSEFVKSAIKMEHTTILEHINLTFEINWLSRACLQELSRHRHTSLSVESTRHTLKKHVFDDEWINEAKKHIEPNFHIAFNADIYLLHICYHSGMSDDEAKRYIREYWPTQLVITLNITELRHILKLRTSPAALKEFQDLCLKMFEVIPDKYKYLVEDCIWKS